MRWLSLLSFSLLVVGAVFGFLAFETCFSVKFVNFYFLDADECEPWETVLGTDRFTPRNSWNFATLSQTVVINTVIIILFTGISLAVRAKFIAERQLAAAVKTPQT